MGPIVVVPVAAVAIYEGGKFLGLWGKPSTVVPPPGVLSDGRPIPTGDPAKDMNNTLKWRQATQGEAFLLVDQPVYKAFQSSAGLSADGFPGPMTMTALAKVLQAKGVAQQDVYAGPTYSFAKATGFDGVHSPTVAQWTKGMPPSHPATTNPPGPATDEGGMAHPNVGGPNAVLTSTGYVSPQAALAGAAGSVAQAGQDTLLAGIGNIAKAAESAVEGG